MRYFNEHRRKLIKQQYIRGTETTVTSDTDELTLANTAGLGINKLEIQGNTEQKSYSGKNLLNSSKYVKSTFRGITLTPNGDEVKMTGTADGNTYINFFSSNPDGLVAMPEEWKGKTLTICSFGSTPYIECGFYSEDGTGQWIGLVASNGFKKTVTLTTETKIWFRVRFTAGNTYNDDIKLMVIEGDYSSQDLHYEPYVGGMTSPNPSYPQKIANTGDNGLELKLRGTNLFDISKVAGYYVDVNTDGTLTISGYPSYIGRINNLCPDLKVGDVVYFNFDTTSSYPQAYLPDAQMYYNRNQSLVITSSVLNSRIGLYKSNSNAESAIVSNLRFTYNKEEYEPYFEPQTISIPVTLCGIDGYNDTLITDFKNKKVTKTERVLYARVSDLITNNAEIDSYENDGVTYHAIVIHNMPHWIGSIDGGATASPYYCTHFTSYHSRTGWNIGEPCVELDNFNGGTDLCFYYIGQTTVEEFKQWCIDNDVRIAYVLENPNEEKIIDATELFDVKTPYDADAILSVPMASSLKATYYSVENEDKLSLTVHYLDDTGATLKESETHSVRKGSKYNLIAPSIDGYEPLQTEYEGYLTDETEITIIYKEIENASL